MQSDFRSDAYLTQDSEDDDSDSTESGSQRSMSSSSVSSQPIKRSKAIKKLKRGGKKKKAPAMTRMKRIEAQGTLSVRILLLWVGFLSLI